MFNYTQLEEEKVHFVEIAPESELSAGERLFVNIRDAAIVVFNIAGEIFAIEDNCTHDEGPLGDGDIDGHNIICPRHGAKFDVRTGKAVSMPAVVDTLAYPVRIRDGVIFVGILKDQ